MVFSKMNQRKSGISKPWLLRTFLALQLLVTFTVSPALAGESVEPSVSNESKQFDCCKDIELEKKSEKSSDDKDKKSDEVASLDAKSDAAESDTDTETVTTIDNDAASDDDAKAIPQPTPERPMQIAVVGRPNAGKSTLINQLLGEDKLLTGPEAGITRDAISTAHDWDGLPIRIFDTAGMRKKARVQEKLEKLSVADGLRAVKFAEVVIVLLDAAIPFEQQDLRIAVRD